MHEKCPHSESECEKVRTFSFVPSKRRDGDRSLLTYIVSHFLSRTESNKESVLVLNKNIVSNLRGTKNKTCCPTRWGKKIKHAALPKNHYKSTHNRYSAKKYRWCIMHHGDDDNDDDTKNNYFLEYERKPRKF